RPRAGPVRDAEAIEVVLVDHALHGGEAHAVELVRGAFELVDLLLRERVARRLVPIRLLVERVEAESLRFDAGFPILARLEVAAAHPSGSHVMAGRAEPAARCVAAAAGRVAA